MENLFYNISQVLGITIIHSLWQGLVIYVALRLVLQFMVDKPAALKYRIAFASLSLMLGWFVYTLYNEVSNYSFISTAPLAPGTDFVPDPDLLPAVPIDRYYILIAGYLPYITMLYIAGLVFNTLKMALAWNNIYRIRQHITQAGFQEQVSNLSNKMGITRFVKVAFSQYIDVPCITGFLKPIILLPCAISTYLTAEEIKAILLHELAHIRRNDYLLNLVQQAIGILLFFNPFSRLINRIINNERENCCDDMVVQTTGTPLVYAQALLKLEQNKQQDWHLALAATGKKYHLLNRIERIMKTKKTTVNIRPALIALALLTCSLSSIAWFNPKIENGKVSVKSIPNPLLENSFFTDTVKPKAKAAKSALKSKPATKKLALKMKHEAEYTEDAKMQKLQAEMEQHAKNIEKYYDSPEFKKLQEQMEKKGAEMEAYYNSPKMKQLQEEMEKKAAEFEKMNDSPEMKKLQADLEANSKKIEAYYSSPEFAKIQKQYEKEAELYGKSKPGSAEYKKHEESFKKLAKEFKDYAKNPAIKEQTEIAKKMSAQMRDYYNSPEFTKKRDEIKAYGDSMRKAFQGPAMKEQQEVLRKMSKEMREYQKNPEIAREQEELKRLSKEMRAYRTSPEYRKKRLAEVENANSDIKEQVRKEIAEAREQETREVRERREVPERKEARERKERAATREVKERRELPEKARKPDTGRVQERIPVKTRKPESAKIRQQKSDEVVIDQPINKVAVQVRKPKLTEVIIDQPINKVAVQVRKPKLTEVVIDQPINKAGVEVKKAKLEEVIIDEPIKRKPGK